METVNALKVRNQLGEILDRLTRTGRPILISRGRKIRAVLVTPEDFKRRFVDVRAAEEKERLLAHVKSLRAGRREDVEIGEVLRRLRGYEE